MLSLVRCSTWDSDNGSEASRCLVPPGATEAGTEVSLASNGLGAGRAQGSFQAGAAGGDAAAGLPDGGWWLLRLGAVRNGRGGAAVGSCCPRSRLSRTERARNAILAWRLERPYLIYCAACFVVTAFLLVWNLAKGVQNNWNLPQWKHHRWEEVLEVTIGVLIVAETLLTLRVVGLRTFFSSAWCIFDFVVALLTVVSICYGLEHLGRNGELCEANVPLLTLRFVLQPARVLAAFASTYRTRQMQNRVDELQVDFNSLNTDGSAFVSMQEL